jgi:DNA-binding transcriptional ArsR family regulator
MVYIMKVDIFSIVADPTRRAMLDVLVEHNHTVSDFVNAFPTISQPAVSKHLKVLRENGLVSVKVNAQQRIYCLRPNALLELDDWISKYKIFWSEP